MKILFFSDNAINGYGGGCIENKKHYDALKCFCQKNNCELKVVSLDSNLEERLPIDIEKNKFLDILSRIIGHSSFLYFSILKNKKMLLDYRPDVVYLGRSRFGFIAKFFKKNVPNCKIITNIDNVEWDYIDAYFAGKNGIKGKIFKIVERRAVKNDELETIKYSDQLVFLTERNVSRYEELYGYKAEKNWIVPICLEAENSLYIESTVKTVIFIGSLDYEANVQAVKSLVNDIWKKHYADNEKIQLVIAGRNPDESVEKMVNQISNITLIKNFENVTSIIPKHSLMLAPIEKGAGMKVKVAEALSMGLMVVGSDEALVGYEEALAQNAMSEILRCNRIEEYENGINSYIEKSYADLQKIENEHKRIFEKYYSFNRSRIYIAKILEMVIFNKE